MPKIYHPTWSLTVNIYSNLLFNNAYFIYLFLNMFTEFIFIY
jgi:hypothetical protein